LPPSLPCGAEPSGEHWFRNSALERINCTDVAARLDARKLLISPVRCGTVGWSYLCTPKFST
jgi:hypothetical protein